MIKNKISNESEKNIILLSGVLSINSVNNYLAE